MFTGIITDVGTIEAVEPRGDTRIRIATSYDTADIDLGASISCSGVCLTVVDKAPGWFAVDVSGETVSRTAQGQWTEGRRLNLERALKLGDELGGHIVTGHVDGTGTIVDLHDEGGSKRITILAGPEIAPYMAEKGSITLDGISLTVNSVEDTPANEGGGVRIGVNIIPHTADVTAIGAARPGDTMNIEIDVLARYLQRMEDYRAKR
ncbi:riboflavin synthase subunit alpha [Sphingomonas panacis]|uniref:Riboflavin synthase n=1 Tax=Sphingomonas panacis TaxID=1560345 RepID=A0A1B3Z7W9_9SPHN|nr:riboflavin synthase [Sphingomonas panacis]AOH83525.1 riboflavin synthase subunit alpha [Sphingomonas panacis]